MGEENNKKMGIQRRNNEKASEKERRETQWKGKIKKNRKENIER